MNHMMNHITSGVIWCNITPWNVRDLLCPNLREKKRTNHMVDLPSGLVHAVAVEASPPWGLPWLISPSTYWIVQDSFGVRRYDFHGTSHHLVCHHIPPSKWLKITHEPIIIHQPVYSKLNALVSDGFREQMHETMVSWCVLPYTVQLFHTVSWKIAHARARKDGGPSSLMAIKMPWRRHALIIYLFFFLASFHQRYLHRTP